jgi:hypothetical protein
MSAKRPSKTRSKPAIRGDDGLLGNAGGVFVGVGATGLLISGSAPGPIDFVFALILILGLYGMFGRYLALPMPKPTPEHVPYWRGGFILVCILILGGIYYLRDVSAENPEAHVMLQQIVLKPNADLILTGANIYVQNDADSDAGFAHWGKVLISDTPTGPTAPDLIKQTFTELKAMVDAELSGLTIVYGTLSEHGTAWFTVAGPNISRSDENLLKSGKKTLFYSGYLLLRRNGKAIRVPFCGYYFGEAVVDCP